MENSFYQKVIIIGGINCAAMSNGFLFGHSAALIKALKKNNEGMNLDDSDVHMIASSLFVIFPVGLGLAAVISDKIGRKFSFIIFSTLVFLSWILLYFAQSMQSLMISRALAGIAHGALFALKLCTTPEYTSSDTRSHLLNMITTLTPAIGTSLAHVLGIIFYWRDNIIIGIILSSFGVFVPYFWVESPHWLASKGRFEECETAFRKLHGNNSEKELQLLLTIEKEKFSKAKDTKSLETYRKLILAAKRRYFWDLMLLSVVISTFITAGGKLVFNTLAIVIIEEMTGSSDILFFTLIIDGFIIAGGIASCILIAKLKMRTLLFTTGFIAICLLITLSACIYFKTESVSIQWINVILLAAYFFVLKTGPYPVLEALLGEIYPLEIKIHCFFISGTLFSSALSVSIILFPCMVTAMGYWGIFLLNAVILSLSLAFIWLKLPETKGRTLQEIEIYFKTKTYVNIDLTTSGEQIIKLI